MGRAADEHVSISRIRETAEVRVRESSLRRVASSVGISPMGLKKFLEGASPYEANRRKLADWYVREAAARPLDGDPTAAAAAVTVLLRDLPVAVQPDATGSLVDLLRTVYGAVKTPPPGWLRGLREHAEAGLRR